MVSPGPSPGMLSTPPHRHHQDMWKVWAITFLDDSPALHIVDIPTDVQGGQLGWAVLPILHSFWP